MNTKVIALKDVWLAGRDVARGEEFELEEQYVQKWVDAGVLRRLEQPAEPKK